MPKKKEQAVYQITVTERQLKLINTALEEFFRIGLNQWGDLADRVANIGFEYPPKDMPNRELVFDRHIHTRDTVRTVLEAAGRILWPYGLNKQDEDNLLAQDIWQAFRHQLWLDRPDRDKLDYCVDGNKPLIQTNEPAPKCVLVGTTEKMKVEHG